MRRIIVDHFDICDQTSAGVGAFDEVVAEQRVSREAMLQHALHYGDFINAFAGEYALAIKVLINV